jgi:hypothetical protein
VKATANPGPSHIDALQSFAALAGRKSEPGVLVHLGDSPATMRSVRLCPWHDLDALPIWE